jgi:hypothetical protein
LLAGGDLTANGDGEHFFTTPPSAGTDKETRVWVIGDSGTANANAAAVRDAYKNFTGVRGTDVWLMLGDNAYSDGRDFEYQAAVFDMYPQLLRQVPLWSALGNHDAIDVVYNPPGAYPQIFSFPTAGESGGVGSGTENYYSFDYGNIHFITLDSSIDANRAAGSPMWSWLAADLAANTRGWTIALWHHPTYSKGSHDSDIEIPPQQMRENALPLLEAGGVDLLLTGHSHSYERSYLVNGHYGPSSMLTPAMILDGGDGNEFGDGAYIKPGAAGTPDEGAVYAVVGSSGRAGGSGSMNHPVMYTSQLTLGSMVLDVSGNRLDAVFINNTGAVMDEFTIIKDPQDPPQEVGILVWPQRSSSDVNIISDDVIQVAVLGSSDFDATDVDQLSLRLGVGETPARPSPPNLKNRDGDPEGTIDPLYRFLLGDSGIVCGDTEVTLVGETLGGERFEGTGTIDVQECDNNGCHP